GYVRNLDVPLQSFHYNVTYGNRPMEQATTLTSRYAQTHVLTGGRIAHGSHRSGAASRHQPVSRSPDVYVKTQEDTASTR
ncbi:hypothetical protein M9458_054200, partial [Cirrhinus mrigala]